MAKRRKKKLKLKKKFVKLIKSIFLMIILCIFMYTLLNKKEIILDVKVNDNILNVTLNEKIKDKLYCALSNDSPTLSSDKWIEMKNNKCEIEYDENLTNIYIKNNKKIIYSSEEEILLLDVNTKKDQIYLAINGKYDFINSFIGNFDLLNINIKDKNIIDFDSSGTIKGINSGNTTLSIKYKENTYKIDILVTNLITTIPNTFDNNKAYLSCDMYTKEENDLIDEILASRIADAGYGTRAGAVEAARFITLEFPYKIDYFYENGRQTTNKVDGEGRYYHTGFYLHSSRYKEIIGSSRGPKTWGCSMYSNPIHRSENNGLDCSGYVSWVLLNAGFDPRDIGAGFASGADLTDLGELKKLTKKLSNSDEIKVGDLLHSAEVGGHIGIIIGKDDEHYYVSQSIWYGSAGVQITTFTKDSLLTKWDEVVLMDSYYKEDGNLTDLWF